MDRLTQYPGSLVLAIALGGHGLRKGSLSLDGAIAAAVLGFLALANPLRAFGIALLTFYFTGSRATKYKAQIKAGLESERSHTSAEGQRNATQVACNALVGTVASIVFASRYHLATSLAALQQLPLDPFAVHATRFWLVLGVCFWAGCMGDTLASELGILARSTPILVTTLKPVPRGTNGGVTGWGLAVSLLGGLWIGVAAAISLRVQTSAGMTDLLALIGYSGLSGLFNSLLDSILGALFQQTLYDDASKKIVLEPTTSSRVVSGSRILSNNAVNAISSTSTAILVAWIASRR